MNEPNSIMAWLMSKQDNKIDQESDQQNKDVNVISSRPASVANSNVSNRTLKAAVSSPRSKLSKKVSQNNSVASEKQQWQMLNSSSSDVLLESNK